MSPRNLEGPLSQAASSQELAADPATSPGGDEGVAQSQEVLFTGVTNPNAPGFVATVAPSGKSIILTCHDDSGAPASITTLGSSNEAQSITVDALPNGGNFTLTFGGQTTTPIPVVALPPSYNCYFTLTGLTAGSAYAIATSYSSAGVNSSTSVLYRVFDGATQALSSLLGAAAIDQSSPPSGFEDDGGGAYGHSTYGWDNLGTFTPTGTTLTVQVSSASTQNFSQAALRLQGPSNVVTYATVANTTVFTDRSLGQGYVANGLFYAFGGSLFNCTSSGSAYINTITGGAATIQAALQALSSIKGGNLTVATSGGGFQATFVGPFSGVGQALIVSSDPGVVVARVSAGGVGSPTLSINGGAPIILKDWLYTLADVGSGGVARPVATCILNQAAPAIRTVPLFSDVFNMVGYWGETYDSTRLSGSFLSTADPTKSLNYPFLALAPGTYRFAATWPVSPTLSTNTHFQITDAAGDVLDTIVVDQTVAPADYSALGHGWKYIGGTYTADNFNTGLALSVTASGTSDLNSCMDAVQFLRSSPDNSIVIGPTDSATFMCPAGWLTTEAGVVPAVANQAVIPPSATSILPAFNASPKTMEVGYNVNVETYYTQYPIFTNFADRQDGVVGLARDANGNPTKVPSPGLAIPLVSPPGSPGGNRLGFSIIPNGRYTLTWQGASDCRLGALGGTVTLVSDADHHRVYDVQPVPGITYSAGINLEVFGTGPDPADPSGQAYLADISNVKVYPPNPSDPTGQTDWADPPKFHPTALYKLQGAKCLRFLDPSSVNINPYGDFSQLKPAGHVSRSTAQATITVPIASIKEPAVPRFFSANVGPYYPAEVQITTAVPHGLFDGATVTLSGTGTATFSGSAIPAGTLDGAACYRLVKVVDATNLLLQVNPFPVAPQTTSRPMMTNVLTGGTLTCQVGTCYPLQDMVDLVTASGAEEIWFNVSVAATRGVGGCVDQIASFFAANLPAGVKIHVEFGNECWNTFFPTAYWCRSLTNQANGTNGDSYVPGFVQATKDTHDRFQAIFAAAGRPNDVIHTYGGMGNNASLNATIAAQATSIGARFDELAVAGYFGNYPIDTLSEPSQAGIYPKMTPDQCLDYLEVNVEYGGYDLAVAQQVAAIATYYPSAKVVFYEASLGQPVPASDPENPPGTPNYFQRSNAIKRHPRMFGIMLRMLQKCQDAGLALWNQYILGLDYKGWTWGTYEGWDQQRGTGNPALEPINISDPTAMDQVKCETGGSLNTWATLVRTTKANPKGAIPGRNGQLRTTGFLRGLLRTVR